MVSKDQATLTNPSDRTIAERNRFADQLDDFTTFSWGNIEDMFVEFGAFIINETKGSLKMYNGASFSNTYTKQQFQDGYTNLAGVTFNTQQISFNIGVYWISIEDYRVLMNVLHPYAVGMLGFSFDKKYGYRCKLSNIKDSTRYILGKEDTSTESTTSPKLKRTHKIGSDSEGYRYYTELQLTFDVLGAQCARQKEPFIAEFNAQGYISNTYNGSNNKWSWSGWPSDLDFPVTIHCNDIYAYQSEVVDSHRLVAWGLIQARVDDVWHNITEPIKMFEINFKNLQEAPTENDNSNATKISLTYDSEQGLVYWDLGSKKQILSLLSINQDGKRFIGALSSYRFYWPGRLNYPEAENSNYRFSIQLDTIDNNLKVTSATCEMSTRTNVL